MIKQRKPGLYWARFNDHAHFVIAEYDPSISMQTLEPGDNWLIGDCAYHENEFEWISDKKIVIPSIVVDGGQGD